MNMLRILLVAFVFLFTGCGALKEQTGEYVTQAVAEKIQKEVEAKLLTKGITLNQVKAATDENGDGHITQGEVVSTLKGVAKDALLLETQRVVNQKIQELQNNVATKNEVDSKSKDLFSEFALVIATLVSAYLGKQIASAKADGRRDLRIAVVEQLLGVKPIGNQLPEPQRNANGTSV